ncbi:DegV family protein with EDD domain [Oceanotoga teriensis]|uniref:DegV family protein with EDD domain n=1 Tax=Oceanotoga teriensis TaxID=515440 RepID=A0AA45HIT0_9BACT|nr:DegV family protein [Oceanotoga teriensis]PWJ93225.1 DegV family protein with EDD domain [Oceanotoga teriensis]
MIGIISDTTSDVPSSILNTEFLEVISAKVILNEKEYRDGKEIQNEQVIKFMDEGGFPKTSLPSYSDISEAFKRLISKGYKKIISINVFSKLSGTYNMFTNVKKDLQKEFKDIKIELIDSKSVSLGSGLLVKKALNLIEKNTQFEEIVKEIKNSIGNKINIMYTIPTLKYLKAGGRIGKVSATIGEFLNIKPIISVNNEGIYYTVSKERGLKRAQTTMVDKMIEWLDGNIPQELYIGRTDDTETTMSTIEKIKQKLINKGIEIEKIKTEQINPSLLSHTGKGLIGITILKS